MNSQIIVPGVLFLCSLITGIWLSHSGKPLNTGIFTIHKLIALAATIITARAIYQLNKVAPMGALEIGAVAVTALLVVSLFVSGAWLSLGKTVNAVILLVHQVAPPLTVIASVATIYLLARGS